jgi:hypothetical protein
MRLRHYSEDEDYGYGLDFEEAAAVLAKERKADSRLHSLRDGDEICMLCGRPSYIIRGKMVLCKKCAKNPQHKERA